MPVPAVDRFTCPCCGAASPNQHDIAQGYCGRCHWWTGDPALGPRHLEAPCRAAELAFLRAGHVLVRDDGRS